MGMANIEPPLSFRSLPPMRYPNLYTWFVLVSSLDIMLTWVVLEHAGGYEVNPVAASVIEHWGLPGAIAFKFSLMLFVIIICEVIGRQRDVTARRLAMWSVCISAFPPAYTLVLVILHAFDSPLLDLAGLPGAATEMLQFIGYIPC
jgi:hypothetical protein